MREIITSVLQIKTGIKLEFESITIDGIQVVTVRSLDNEFRHVEKLKSFAMPGSAKDYHTNLRNDAEANGDTFFPNRSTTINPGGKEKKSKKSRKKG